MRAVSTDWAKADDAASVAAKAIGKANELGFLFMGVSSGFVFSHGHCIAGRRA
jgi:hypothetical protein